MCEGRKDVKNNKYMANYFKCYNHFLWLCIIIITIIERFPIANKEKIFD